MIGVALIVLVFGALIAAIWGQKAAQGCFINVLKGIGYMVIVGLTAVIPQLMLPLMAMYGLYLIGSYVAKANRAKTEEGAKTKLIENLNVVKSSLDDAMVPIGQAKLNAALAGATSKAQRFMPRSRAVTVMPGATIDSVFWSTHVRDQQGSRYVIVEERTKQFIVLTSSQFIQDWVPWMAPTVPKPQTASTPQWRSAND